VGDIYALPPEWDIEFLVIPLAPDFIDLLRPVAPILVALALEAESPEPHFLDLALLA
jgi:hypothetical protein